MRPKLKKIILFLLIIFLGVGLRFFKLNWDSNQHLNPDERFLTMVGLKLKAPNSLLEYLDPAGQFSPYGVGEYFFVYGTLPLNLTKIIATLLAKNQYHQFTLIGRTLAAGSETLTLILVILLTHHLAQPKKKIQAAGWAGLIYATTVLPIQQAHFFTSDAFLVLFLTFSHWACLKARRSKNTLLFTSLAGASWGLSLACKLSALYWLIPILILLFWDQPKSLFGKKILLFSLTAYFALRLGDPHLFATPFLLNPQPNLLFLQNIKTLNYWNSPKANFPPGVQWLPTGSLYGLKHNFLWGMGPLLGSIILISLFSQLKKGARSRKISLPLVLSFSSIIIFTYLSLQFAKPLRYFYPLYPVLTGLAGLWMANYKRKPVIFIAAILIYPVMFLAIYAHPNSRVAASEWIYENVPTDSIIATEYWDDALPLPLEKSDNRQYQFESLDLYAPENKDKWEKIDQQLAQVDYLIISSNRLTGSIPKVPNLYPETSQYYQKLFAEKLGFKQVAEFHSFPCFPPVGKSWFCLNDQGADETFTVYDHPRVVIFRKTRPLP